MSQTTRLKPTMKTKVSRDMRASTETQDATPDLDAFQLELVNVLGIPSSLIVRSNVTDLRLAYAKYLGYTKAQSLKYQMLRDKTWMLKNPSDGDIIGIFASRSGWYGSYTLFAGAESHSDMKKWLEGNSDIGDAELWGKAKMRYTFKDLRTYLEQHGHDLEGGGDKGKGKGKGKGKEKEKGKGKEKEKGKRKAAGSISEGHVKKRDKKKKKAQSDEESSGSS
jgi:hypothetical protein